MTTKINRRTFVSLASFGAAAFSVEAKTTPSERRRPHYAMVFDQTKCVGCGDCQTACHETNHLPEGQARLLMERISKPHRVIGKEPCPHCGKLEACDCERRYIRVSCQQCEDAPCVTVCPTGAAHHDPITGIVTMDPDRLEACDCERRYIRVSCQQCEDAPCVTVCPTGAAHHDPITGIVTMDPDRCVGCKYCIVACPYNARFINEETKVADNCDFCLHTRLAKGESPACVASCKYDAYCIVACPYNARFINEETKVADNCDFCLHTRLAKGESPACVASCKYDALVFGDINDPYSYISRLLKVKDTVRIRPELGTEPSLRYIPVVKKGV